jgi:hypothetical protein
MVSSPDRQTGPVGTSYLGESPVMSSFRRERGSTACLPPADKREIGSETVVIIRCPRTLLQESALRKGVARN